MLNVHPQFYILLTEALCLNSCKNQEVCCLRNTQNLAQNKTREATVNTKHHNNVVMISNLYYYFYYYDYHLVVWLKDITTEFYLQPICVARVSEKQEHHGSHCSL